MTSLKNKTLTDLPMIRWINLISEWILIITGIPNLKLIQQGLSPVLIDPITEDFPSRVEDFADFYEIWTIFIIIFNILVIFIRDYFD